MSGQNYIFSCLLYMAILQKHSSYTTEAIFLSPASPQVVSMENSFCIISLLVFFFLNWCARRAVRMRSAIDFSFVQFIFILSRTP